jgi:hypothetical protein
VGNASSYQRPRTPKKYTHIVLSAKSLSLDIIGGEDVEELVDYIQKPFS